MKNKKDVLQLKLLSAERSKKGVESKQQQKSWLANNKNHTLKSLTTTSYDAIMASSSSQLKVGRSTIWVVNENTHV